MGAVQYYFSTRDELLLFAGRQLLADTTERIEHLLGAAEQERSLDTRSSAFDLAYRLAAETLPIDERHRSEQLLWLALMVRASREPNPQPAIALSWESLHSTARMAVAALVQQEGWLVSAAKGAALPEPAEDAATDLHITLDGLFLQGLLFPDRNATALEQDLRAILARLRADLEIQLR